MYCCCRNDISLHKTNFTPFNLGLALQLYHGYGSKHLIETLHAFGMHASYTEVRQFLTSAANHEIAKTEVLHSLRDKS